jgi:hypothetical protein
MMKMMILNTAKRSESTVNSAHSDASDVSEEEKEELPQADGPWISMNCLLFGTYLSATGSTTASNFCLIMFVLLIV